MEGARRRGNLYLALFKFGRTKKKTRPKIFYVTRFLVPLPVCSLRYSLEVCLPEAREEGA